MTPRTHVVTPEIDPDQSVQAQIGRVIAAGFTVEGIPSGEPVVVMPNGEMRRLEADDCGCGQCETLYRLLPWVAS